MLLIRRKYNNIWLKNGNLASTFFCFAPSAIFSVDITYLPILRHMRSNPLRVSGVEPANV